jgi:predicted nucleotidyltransferase
MEILESININPVEVSEDVLKYVLKSIGSRDERISAFTLFGSRARGSYRENIDVDLAVTSTSTLSKRDIDNVVNEVAERLNPH